MNNAPFGVTTSFRSTSTKDFTLYKRSEVSFDPFAFLEAKLWIQNERWNVRSSEARKIRSCFPGTHSLLRPLSQSLALNSMDLAISSSGLDWELPLGAPRRTYRILRAATTWILQTKTWWNGWGFQAYLDQLESDDGNLTGTKWNKYEGLQPIECGITRNTMELGLCIHYA